MHVLQGERQLARDNRTLGRFQLVGIPAAPRGVPQIEVTFDIDANGIVHVSAKDRGTGKEQSMTITGGSSLPRDEIDRMMRDAQDHADEDRRRREEAETRNQAEALQWQTERFVAENGDKIPGDVKDQLNEALGELRSALGGSDQTAIKSAHEKLVTISQQASVALYQQAGAAAGTDAGAGPDAGAPTGGPDDVVDAEIVDDEKKWDDKK